MPQLIEKPYVEYETIEDHCRKFNDLGSKGWLLKNVAKHQPCSINPDMFYITAYFEKEYHEQKST